MHKVFATYKLISEQRKLRSNRLVNKRNMPLPRTLPPPPQKIFKGEIRWECWKNWISFFLKTRHFWITWKSIYNFLVLIYIFYVNPIYIIFTSIWKLHFIMFIFLFFIPLCIILLLVSLAGPTNFFVINLTGSSDRYHTIWSGVYRGEWYTSRW